jgi:hypothetical protein
MRYKSESGKDGIDRHVEMIKQINDGAWQTRGRETGTDFVNMRQAIY